MSSEANQVVSFSGDGNPLAKIFNYLKDNHPKKSLLAAAFCSYYLLKKVFQTKKDVKGKVVLITGGASGIGATMAEKFSSLGAHVVLWDIDNEKLDTVARNITKKTSNPCWGFKVDVTELKQVEDNYKKIKEQKELGRVDILINNAGIVSGDLITNVPPRSIELTFKVNVLAHFWTIKTILPEMLGRNSGHIVTIASAAGTTGCAKLVDYCASKFAVIGLDEALRLELRHRGASGIKTTCVCPYYINTGMFDGVKTRFGFLLPILEEDYASQRIVDAILTNTAFMAIPPIVYITYLLRFLLPTSIFDSVEGILGVNQSMDHFKGRNEEKGE